MIVPNIKTSNPNIELVEPDISRDPKISLSWINSVDGPSTLASMGNIDSDIKPTTIGDEIERTDNFIHDKNQLNWMIKVDNEIVGAIWVDLLSKDYLPSPSVHLMVGDSNARNKGVGYASLESVINYMENEGYDEIFTRHLTSNIPSSKLLSSLKFDNIGSPYKDKDNLEWQNLSRKLSNT